MSESKFSVSAVLQLSDYRDRQSLIVDVFNQAMEEDDAVTACDAAEWVVGDDTENTDFSASFQLHCLNWLMRYYRFQYSNTEDNSAEEDIYLDKIFHVLWQYKWIVSRLPYDISISREEIEQANELMTEAYNDFHLGHAPIAKALMVQNMHMGNVDAVQMHYAQWREYAKNKDENLGRDCEACEQDSMVQYLHFVGDYAAAVKAAAPILSGQLSCGEVPHTTYHYVVDSLLRLGREEEAMALLEQGIDLITQIPNDNIHLLAPLIYLKTRLNLMQEASDLLDEYSETIVDASVNNRLYYFEYLLCVAPFNDDALTAAQEVAQQFDERNGNSFYQDKLTLMFGNIVLH